MLNQFCTLALFRTLNISVLHFKFMTLYLPFPWALFSDKTFIYLSIYLSIDLSIYLIPYVFDIGGPFIYFDIFASFNKYFCLSHAYCLRQFSLRIEISNFLHCKKNTTTFTFLIMTNDNQKYSEWLGFNPRSSHTKDFKNGTWYRLTLHLAL